MTAISRPSQQKIDVIKQDNMFSIRKCDWKRIKRLVNKISKPSGFPDGQNQYLLGWDRGS